MLEPTKTPLTSEVQLSFMVPVDLVEKVMETMHSYGLKEENEGIPWRDAFNIKDRDVPPTYLRGARYREDVTQKELSLRTGIPVRHISEMENGKRPIGKKNAAKLANALHCNARALLSL